MSPGSTLHEFVGTRRLRVPVERPVVAKQCHAMCAVPVAPISSAVLPTLLETVAATKEFSFEFNGERTWKTRNCKRRKVALGTMSSFSFNAVFLSCLKCLLTEKKYFRKNKKLIHF